MSSEEDRELDEHEAFLTSSIPWFRDGTRNCLNWRVAALRCRKSAGEGGSCGSRSSAWNSFIILWSGRLQGACTPKRIVSLANGVVGVVTGASLAVSVIGHALARARGLVDRHAIKQVDRLLSNAGVVVWELFAPWVREMVGQREAIVVAMDWTDFDADNQAALALNLVTRHGRATPLLWLTVDKDELKDQRNDFEGPLPLPSEGASSRRCGGDDPGRSGLRRRQAVRVPRQARLRLRHPLSRQCSSGRGGRRDAPGRRLGRQGRTGAPAARRQGHGRPPQGRRGGLRPRHGA